ncbi:Glycosyltransferase involved in cell wall bisynthesis [Belliella buryatensis]|uniref:Glycosyltransferase involved in cell wall bisynthesis n=1 Tax=Belliella buryatensis TaxID=1500549 RepID=A0A239BIY0_9BACT|nr:glycosyltransferase family 4 protein [Belliella buryatensis]SNS07562.1 Glycosyltransferase involved in cell wall bisynthesis [Belliella buryatensis]
MKKILLINSYSFDKIYEDWVEGRSPGHFLFGKIDLEKLEGFEVDILPFEKYPLLNRIGRFFRINFLDQQLRTFLLRKNYDIIYAPFPLSNTRLLTILKYLGIFKKPIVALGHQNLYSPPLEGQKHGIKRKLLLQYDRIGFLSSELLKKTSLDLAIDPDTIQNQFTHLNWGAEKSFYEGKDQSIPSEESSFAICAGATDRDFELIIEVFREIEFPLEIYCTPATIPKVVDLPAHITINANFIPYIELLERYRKSRLILIPIKKETINSGRTLGLTVLLDAMAIGKPVVMTANKYVDINPSLAGFGVTIQSHEVEAWKPVLLELLYNHQKLNQMGKKAKSLFEEKYNSKLFGDELASLFRNL